MTQTSGARPGADRPFFRYDLQTKAIEDGGHRFVDVTDPSGGSSFRFFEVEYAVACGMDGERDLEALVSWAKSELDLKTTTEELGAIVSKLAELRYLSGPQEAAPLGPTPDDVVASLPEVMSAPQAASEASGIDVELGHSGKSPIAAERPQPPSSGANFELGMAGASDAPAQGASGGGDDDVMLGAAGNEEETQVEVVPGPSKEVSTDLSQTFRIDKDEVKAAVRASKVMSAVEIPDDLDEELTRTGGEAAVAAEAALAAEKRDAAIPENVSPLSDISDSIADEAEESKSGGDAIVLPDAPAKVAAAPDESAKKKKKKLGPRRNSISYVLLVLLLMACTAAAVYYYMEYVREQPDEKGPEITRQQFAAKQKAQAPVKPKALTGTLNVTEAPTAEVAATRGGVVSWVIEASSEVAEGDELLKLSGAERVDKTIERHQKSLASYETQLAAAQGKSASRIASIESNVARKKLDIQLANEKRDVFIVKAPISGVVEVLAASGRQIKVGAAIAKITGTASATVTFTLPAGAQAAADDELEVVAAEDAELKATCKVTEVQGQKATLSCPADSGLSDGEALQLTLP